MPDSNEQKLLKKLAISKLKPEQAKDMTPSELAELVFLVLEYIKKVNKDIADGKIKGDKGDAGFSPIPDVDFITTNSAVNQINEILKKVTSQVEKDVANALSKIKNGDPGKDAKITHEHIELASRLAYEMIELPDFTTLITQEPEAIRNALELFTEEEDKLSIDAIGGLNEILANLRAEIGKGAVTTFSGGKKALRFMNDVEIANIQIGHTLVWNGSKFVNQAGGSGTSTWGDIVGTLSDQTDLQNALDAKADSSDLADYIPLTQKGANSGVAPLDSSGKIASSYLPALAITDVSVVASQVAQLALTAEEGDVAIRSDLNKSYIHNGGTAGTMADWSELLTPTDAVLSVNGSTGAVTLTTSDITEGSNLYYTDERVDDRINSLISAGIGIKKTYDDAGNAYTLDLDITELTAETSIADDDLVLIYDTSTSTHKKMTKANFVSGLGGGGVAWGDITGTLSDQTDLQTALDGKQATITGLTASGAELNILDGATLSTAELNYVDGVTSSIQAQLDGKAPSLGADDNYVTDAEKVKLSNLSGTNTGDQDLSPYFNKSVDDTDDITVGATNKFATAAEKTKLGHITITQAVDLDAIESRVNALDAAVVLKGAWDASAGTFPGGGTAQAGDSYIVSVAGTVDGIAFSINDRILAILDNASTGTYASNWLKLDYTDQVLSVAGKTGAVSLVTADITDITASAAELNILDGATLTTAELNYVDGVTSGIQAQIDGKANSSHTHTKASLTDIADFLLESEVDADIKTLSLPASTTISAFGATLVDDADASAARTTLGLVIGTHVQAFDADLNTIAGLTATTNNFIVSVASAWASRTPAQVRTTLGLVIGTNVQAWDADLDTWATKTAPSGVVLGTTDSQQITNKTLGDALIMAENAAILMDPAMSADGKYNGITRAGTAGTTLAFGDLVYLDPTDSRWELADANSAAGADGDARGVLGICVLAAAGDGSATTILLYGIVRADTAFPALTVNNPVYVSETAGDVTVTQPTTADVVIRVVGFGLTADEMFFCPSPDYITHI